MGKEPGMLAPMPGKVTVVACHPKNDILAAGYSDGTVMLVRLNDGAEILARAGGTRCRCRRWPGMRKARRWRSRPSRAMADC